MDCTTCGYDELTADMNFCPKCGDVVVKGSVVVKSPDMVIRMVRDEPLSDEQLQILEDMLAKFAVACGHQKTEFVSNQITEQTSGTITRDK